MKTTQETIVAVFDNHDQAEAAIHELNNAGITSDRIRFAGSEAPKEGFLGTIKSLFTGQKTGAYDDLISLDVPPADARYYQQEYEAKHSILAVMSDGQKKEITNLLARNGGYGTGRRVMGQTASAGTMGQTADTAQTTNVADQQHIKLREEQLRVQKQSVETGEARLQKEVVAEQQSMNVPITHEEVYIERHAGSGLPDNEPIREGQTYRIPVHEEQITVEKQPIVREELVLGKRKVQENKRIADTVRKEEAHIEQSGDVHIRNLQNPTEQQHNL